LPAHSPSRPRPTGRGLAEVYSAVAIVAITVALSSAVYSQAHFSVGTRPVFSFETYSVVGSPSILHLQVNSSSPSELSEVRLDEASSYSGVLALGPSGYSTLESLCAGGVATFFSVNTTAGALSVSSNGEAWIDGVQGTSAQVGPGLHELVISDASVCTVILPDGRSVQYPSASVSTVPRIGDSQFTTTLLVPFNNSGHSITAVFGSAIEVVDF